jgi:hypothetical protein
MSEIPKIEKLKQKFDYIIDDDHAKQYVDVIGYL